MKARSAGWQWVLAVIALVAAYVTWQRPKETVATDSVVALDATKQTLEKVRFDDGTRFLELTHVAETTWVTTGFLPGKRPVFDAGLSIATLDAGVDGGAIAVTLKPPEPPPTREVHGNDRADTLFSKFTPLDATRALGALSSEKAAELGLKDTDRRLALTVSGTVHSFLVSKPSSGVIGTYLLDEKSQQVYLLQSSMFTELDPASQVLIDRRLHAFRPADFDRFTVTAGGKSAEFVQTNAEIAQTTKVARVATPDKPDELVKNWGDKVWNRLIVTEVLGKGELPKSGEPKVELRVEYSSHGKSKGWLEVGFDSTAATWARSENTASWVAVHQGADELVIEAKQIAAKP